MSTAVADPPVSTSVAPVAAAAAPSSVPAAGSPAGVGAGSGAGGAPAPASGDPAKIATPSATAPKSLLAGIDEPVKPAEVAKAAEPAAKVDDWKLEAPKDVTIDAKDLSAVETFAKENGLSKAQAEKVLARDVAARTQAASAQQAQIAQVANDLAAQVENHPELGGQNLQRTVDNAKKAMVAVFSPEERKAIVESPLGNHPLLIKLLNFAASRLREDTIHADATTAPPVIDGPAIIYGDRYKR